MKNSIYKKLIYIKYFIGLIILLLISSCGTSRSIIDNPQNTISVLQIETDTLFNSNQQINLLKLNKSLLNKYTIDIGFIGNELIKTSELAKAHNAIAAINGGFFDMSKGGSVTYFEKNDSIINANKSDDFKWSKPDSLMNGVILLTKNNKLKIQPAKTNEFYKKSKNEAFVLNSGPLLIRNSVAQKLPNMKFTKNRHPRTCLCITNESIVFITIDGRQEKAAGMNLYEVQNYLSAIKCKDAINLDGGGSTTMWLKTKGIVNSPSDKKGERAVANAILLLKNKKSPLDL